MLMRLSAYPAAALVLASLSAASAVSQCSDAGACTISRHAGMEQGAGSTHDLGVRYTFGQSGSPDDVTYHSVSIDANLHLLSMSRLMVSLPFNVASGPLGNAGGIGDLIVIWDQTAIEWEGGSGRLGLQAGGRFATGDANAEPQWPMAYQPGLGSTDLILGASGAYNGWSIGGAYQIAGERNDNERVRLKRGDQLLFWGSYEFDWASTRLQPGVTVIKQLQESSVRDTAAGSTATIDVAGSDQLQVNLGLRARHELTSRFGLELFGALPLKARDVNVDGLKRSLTLSVTLFATL
jgi:hypothetical protein